MGYDLSEMLRHQHIDFNMMLFILVLNCLKLGAILIRSGISTHDF